MHSCLPWLDRSVVVNEAHMTQKSSVMNEAIQHRTEVLFMRLYDAEQKGC